MRKTLFVCGFLLIALRGSAQRIQLSDLLHYLGTPTSKFDEAMFRQGFVCYSNTIDLRGWTCLFAYQPIPYLAAPDQATAVIQYTHTSRSVSGTVD